MGWLHGGREGRWRTHTRALARTRVGDVQAAAAPGEAVRVRERGSQRQPSVAGVPSRAGAGIGVDDAVRADVADGA